MKLLFDNIVLGKGSPYLLGQKVKGLSGNLDTTKIKIPRSDFSRHISSYLGDRVRVFSGWIVASDLADLRTKKRALINRLRNDYEFTLIDDYVDNNGNTQIFATYTFNGRLDEVECDEERWIQNKVPYKILISSEDPHLYSEVGYEETSNIKPKGFIFPLTFPFVFTGSDNTIIIDNDGGVPIFPTIKLHGQFTNVEIVHYEAQTTNKSFTYTGFVSASDEVIITPFDTDPIKVRKNGVSVVNNTNYNFSALEMPIGTNTFSFFLTGDEDSNTQATLSFSPAFVGI